MRMLDIKVFRDLGRLWAQALAIALVVAGGVSTLVLAVGSYRSLDETRIAYYERYGFADVFALVKRAPKTLVEQIAQIPGVAVAETRITELALLDIPNFREPATGELVSLPDNREPILNRLYLRMGRMPVPESATEAVVNESFASAHGFTLGSRFSAILNGRKQELVIVGMGFHTDFFFRSKAHQYQLAVPAGVQHPAKVLVLQSVLFYVAVESFHEITPFFSSLSGSATRCRTRWSCGNLVWGGK